MTIRSMYKISVLAAAMVATFPLSAVAQQGPSAQAEAAVAADSPLGMYNVKKHGMCLVESGGTVHLYSCNDDYNDQYWHLYEADQHDYLRLRNDKSGKCLAMVGWNDGDRVSTYRCERDYTDQDWLIKKMPENTYRIQNRKTGKCLEPRSSHPYYVEQFTCVYDRDAQRWSFARRN